MAARLVVQFLVLAVAAPALAQTAGAAAIAETGPALFYMPYGGLDSAFWRYRPRQETRSVAQIVAELYTFGRWTGRQADPRRRRENDGDAMDWVTPAVVVAATMLLWRVGVRASDKMTAAIEKVDKRIGKVDERLTKLTIVVSAINERTGGTPVDLG